jgi:hypothetical protein
VFIDDRQDTIETWAKLNPSGLAIMVAQPYNKGSALLNVVSAENWAEIARLLELFAEGLLSTLPLVPESKFMLGSRVRIDTSNDGSRCHGMEGHIANVDGSAVVVRTLEGAYWTVQEHEVVVIPEQQGSAKSAAPEASAQRPQWLPSEDVPERKAFPSFVGCVGFFPDILSGVALVSADSGKKYHKDGKIEWHKEKGGNRYDALMRHLQDIAVLMVEGKQDSEEFLLAHRQLAWNALAVGQLEIDRRKAKK